MLGDACTGSCIPPRSVIDNNLNVKKHFLHLFEGERGSSVSFIKHTVYDPNHSLEHTSRPACSGEVKLPSDVVLLAFFHFVELFLSISKQGHKFGSNIPFETQYKFITVHASQGFKMYSVSQTTCIGYMELYGISIGIGIFIIWNFLN